MNSKALSLRVDRSSLSSSSSMGDEAEASWSVDDDDESGGGKVKAPCRLPPPVGKGRPTVGVGPQSTGGRISDGRNVSND
jgi:hypothetical protein